MIILLGSFLIARLFEDDEFGKEVVEGNDDDIGDDFPEHCIHVHQINRPDHDSKIKNFRHQTKSGKGYKFLNVLLEGLVAAFKDEQFVGHKGDQHGSQPGNQVTGCIAKGCQIVADMEGSDVDNRCDGAPEALFNQFFIFS